ncbi:hydroxyacid dehydrogenase [Alkalihalophilus pseudofirmus]|nr:hydroxyacid dehydrogenase [Alkalihalophilus pseudofirmus]
MKILQILSMYHPKGEETLRKSAEVIQTNNYDPEHVKKLLQGVDGIVLRAPGFINAEILNEATTVKAISGAGVGLDNIDVQYATKKGIPILHAPKVNTDSTAEHAISLMFALMKKLLPLHTEMIKGNFSYRNSLFTNELIGKRLGLVGFGTIAQKVAKVCSIGLGMEVISYVRRIDEEKLKRAKELNVKLSQNLSEVMETSDIISLHIPLTNDTKKLITYDLLSSMKPTAYFINTARGGVVDENGLCRILKEKKIAGAGIDVYTQEPPSPDHPLYHLDNVLLTPHVGGISEEAAEKSSVLVAENLLATINGERPKHIANPEVYKESVN